MRLTPDSKSRAGAARSASRAPQPAHASATEWRHAAARAHLGKRAVPAQRRARRGCAPVRCHHLGPKLRLLLRALLPGARDGIGSPALPWGPCSRRWHGSPGSKSTGWETKQANAYSGDVHAGDAFNRIFCPIPSV